MSGFIAWLPESGWSRLLCDALWQSTLIATVGYVAARFLTRQSAARAWLLLLTLTACLLVPLASMAAREAGWTTVARRFAGTWPRLSETRDASLGETRPRDFAENETMLAAQPKAAPTTPTDASPWHAASGHNATTETFALNALGIVWLTASALLTLRLALSCLATVRLIRRAAVCGDAELIAAGATAAQRVGLSKPPVLLISHDVRTPTVFALCRPRLLIPADDASRAAMKNVDWTAAFTHELAHVARRDGWSRLWVEFILIALPLQPLVWLARRAFHTACEEACDDWAVATGSNPVDLAEMLTAWMHGSQPRPTLLAIGMSSTKARTLRLLALRSKPIARLSRSWRWAGIPTVLLLIGGLAIAQSPYEKKHEPSPPPTAPTKGESKAAIDKPTGSSGKQTNPPPYIIEPPDILTISAVQLAPKEITRVAPLDKVRIEVHGTNRDQPISGLFQVDSSGEVVLGPVYGALKIAGRTRVEAENAVKKKLEEVLKEPDVALIIDEGRRESGIAGEHLVGPDGRINLGVYGSVKVAGLTVADASAAVKEKLSDSFIQPKVALDVYKFNSKVYYVITEDSSGDSLRRLPSTGNDTVLDAISACPELARNLKAIKSVAISRPASSSSKSETLQVHWKDVLHGDDSTNYQILPGDRLTFVTDFAGSNFGGATGGDTPRPTAANPSKP